MSAASGGGSGEAPGKEGSPAGEANVGGSETEESGYRRDDYWREESRDDVEPGTESEPDDGFAFESPEERERAKAGSSAEGDSGSSVSDEAREQGNAGGRDDANIVEER